ncbi:uncharacterized protein LOC134787548 [Penaeus indicus]|uniref:uncharacterized protein LOC134787548 n=1 Tax=Penaeus indicus TaxID=29960 RepID=UPI00300BFEBC
MALTRLSTGIQQEDHNTFRLYKAHRGPARCVMLAILNWGCQKAPEVTYEEYLLQNLGYTNKKYKTIFDGAQREKLKYHSSGDELDISLLYKLIQNTCAGVAPATDNVWTSEDFSRLEFLVNYIKNSRNNLAHNDHEISNSEIVRRLEKLRDVLVTTLKVGRDLFCIPHSEVDTLIKQVSDAITAIREHPFAQTDVLHYQNDLLFEDLREIMSTDGAKEVAKIFSRNNLLNLNPVSFISGGDCHLKVDRVFIDIQMYSVESGVRKAIDYRDILVYSHETNNYPDNHSINSSQQSIQEKPVIHLVEGDPGSGKTTLLKFIMSDWKKQTNIIKELSDYHLVLYFECHNPYKDSLADFLVSQMPLTSTRFHKSDLVRCLLGLKVLLLIDGLDELNSASKRFFKEILHLKKNSDISVLCTTRSEKLKEISRMIPNDLMINYFKLLGIPSDKRGKFVELYHEELKRRGMSAGNTNSIVQYVENASLQLNEFFVYPLNLVLLTYLWVTRPESINAVTSVTVLYAEVHSLMVEKLHRRLLDDPDIDYIPSEEIKGRCEQFLDALYQFSFATLSYNMVYLDQEHVNRLLQVCSETKLAVKHMMSSFLVVELTSSGEQYVERHRFPHKGIQEFYGAQYILSIISNENLAKNRTKVLEALEECLRKFHISSYERQEIASWTSELSERKRISTLLGKTCPVRFQEKGKYTNLLQHLVGLLRYQSSCLLFHYTEEIVELLNDSGDLSFDQWTDLLKKTDYDALVAKEVAKFVCQISWTIRDDQERAAAALITHRCPRILSIELFKEPKNLPHLVDLLRSAFAKGSEIRLHLHSHWRDPKSASSDGILCALQRSSLNENQEWEYYHEPAWKNLTRFTGRVTSPAVLARLGDSIEGLRVAIRSDDEALDWSVNINSCDVFVRLKWIGVHVAAAGVDPALLCPLPSLERRPHLYLSGVSDCDVEWASVVAKALQPRTTTTKCQGAEIWTREPAPTPTPEYEDYYILLNTEGGEASQGRGLAGNDQKQETAAEAERESDPYETFLQTDCVVGDDNEDIYETISYDHGSLPYASRKTNYIPHVPPRVTKQPLPMPARPREPLLSKYYNSQPRPPMPIPTELQPETHSGSLPPKPTLRFPPRQPLKPSLKTRWVKTPRPPVPLPSKLQETQAPKSRRKPPHSSAKASKPPRSQAPVAPQPVMWPAPVYPWSSAQPPHTLQLPLCAWPPVFDLQWTPWGMPVQRLVPMAPMLQPCVSWGMQWAPSGGSPSTVTGPALQHHGVQISPLPSVSNGLDVHSDQNDNETLYENLDD